MLDTNARKYIQPMIEGVANCFVKMNVSANQITAAAFFAGVSAAVSVYFGKPFLGVGLLWLSGLLDVVDGTVARKTGSTSSMGTLMDILFDRIVEIGMLLALMLTDKSLAQPVAFVLSAIIISMTIFLNVGATAEKQGYKSFYYQAGLMERTEGFIMISLAVLVSVFSSIILIVFALAIIYTALQRFIEAVKILKK
jgi:archaetidylinositol phosphate synthase